MCALLRCATNCPCKYTHKKDDCRYLLLGKPYTDWKSCLTFIMISMQKTVHAIIYIGVHSIFCQIKYPVDETVAVQTAYMWM